MSELPRRTPAAAGGARGRELSDSLTLKALSHPTRVQILACLRGREDSASPAELARELDLPLSAVSYHTRSLAQLGMIKLVTRRQRRGAIQHYYALAPAAAQDELVRQMTARAAAEAPAGATGSDGGEPLRAHTRALLDATAVGELRGELRQLFERLRALEAETVQRAGVKGQARTFGVEVSCAMDTNRRS